MAWVYINSQVASLHLDLHNLMLLVLKLRYFAYLQGRFGEEFVEKRKEKLQQWINRICLHPVLSQSLVFKHFITCGDNEKVIR